MVESEIEIFCDGCKWFRPEGNGYDDSNCQLLTTVGQARFVNDRLCGWANVNEINGKMTIEGFVPSNYYLNGC